MIRTTTPGDSCARSWIEKAINANHNPQPSTPDFDILDDHSNAMKQFIVTRSHADFEKQNVRFDTALLTSIHTSQNRRTNALPINATRPLARCI